MNLTVAVLQIVMPAIIAYLAVILALTCKYHSISRAVIIPDNAAEKASNSPQVSDLNTRQKSFTVIAYGLGFALILSLLLVVLTNYQQILAVFGPLFSSLDGLSANLLTVAYGAFVLAISVPTLARSFTWMTKVNALLAVAVCAGIFLAWVLVDSWITFNLMTGLICLIGALMLQQRISFLRLSLFLLVLAVVYDAWQVFGTGNMVELATNSIPKIGAAERQITYPTLLLLPGSLSLTPRAYGILGAGDVVVFSVMAIAAARFGKKIGSRVPVIAVFAGFAVAITVCSLVGWYFKSGQPATIYIVPLCALPVILYAKRHGSFDQLSVPFYDRPAKSFWKM